MDFFNQQQNAILNLVPATAAQLMMIGYFQVGPTKKYGNFLKQNDAINMIQYDGKGIIRTRLYIKYRGQRETTMKQ